MNNDIDKDVNTATALGEITARSTAGKGNVEHKHKKTWGILIVVLALCILGHWLSQNFLWGNDKAAYEILVACADNFNDPSSLRLTSGKLGVDKNCMWVTLSAKNGFGDRISRNYFLSLSGTALSERDARNYSSWDSLETEWCSEKGFDAQKVNRIYGKKHGGGVDDDWGNTHSLYGNMGTFSWILLIAALAIHVIAATAFQKVALQKGHEGYFGWCFFLGLAGWLMVAALPDRNQEVIQTTMQPTAPSSASVNAEHANEDESLPEL